MKRFILYTLLFCFFIPKVYGLEIVYPKTTKINAKSTFFIGNALPSENLKINGKTVPVLQSGEFAYVVPLNYGENIFNIKTETRSLVYKIIRSKPANIVPDTARNLKDELFTVITEGATLREKPVDAGINRLSQLPCGTELIINGEKGSFYKVKLSESDFAWIAKNEVQTSNENNFKPAKIHELRTRHDREYDYYRFKLSKKIPFSIVNQNEKVILKFYNTNKPLEIEAFNNLGFSYYYDEKGIFILKIRKKFPQKPTIIIDAGHGGKELGAIGCNGSKEKDVNLKIANYLKKELENDFNIVMTRESDIQISLKDRVKTAVDNDAFILLSIHSNALPDGEDPNLHRGTSTYYYHKQSKPLAESILYEMIKQAGTNNDRVRQRSLALIRPTGSISVLVEVAYMINPYDNIMLSDESFQLKAAQSLAAGVRRYIKSITNQCNQQ